MIERNVRTVHADQPGSSRGPVPWIREVPESPSRYNIAPTQPILTLPNDDQQKLDFFLWGLIPFWAKDPSIGSQMCNARAETLATKNSYKHGCGGGGA